MVVALLWACAGEPPAAGLPVTAEVLTRASLDVRGVRPSEADLRRVADDPAAGEDLLDAYLADARFGDRVRDAFAPVYLTRADESDLADADYALLDEPGFLVGMGEEPLRILAQIAAEDLPYTDIVRADWTMADDALAERFPVDYPAGETGWRKVRYTDARPSAGILSTSGLWWRYPTTTGNANRGRAAALMRILTCQDFLEQDIVVDPTLDLLDDAAVQSALTTNPGCVGCHHSLDPIGSYLWGSYVEFSWNVTDLAYYHPERESLWQTYGGDVPAAYYGEPGEGVEGLGRQIAQDPRLISCIVEQVREVLLRRPARVDERDALTAHRESFLAAGLTVRALYGGVLREAAYRSSGEDGPWKLVSPELYVSQVEGLTGYRFTVGGRDVIQYDTFGLRTLAGGGRSVYGASSASDATPTATVVLERIAEAAAAHVVAHDREERAAPRLFTELDPGAPAEDDATVAQIQTLYLRILGRTVGADGAEVAEVRALWDDLHALDGQPATAWQGVVAAMLRHPDFLVY